MNLHTTDKYNDNNIQKEIQAVRVVKLSFCKNNYLDTKSDEYNRKFGLK